jgi:uncharacterized protein
LHLLFGGPETRLAQHYFIVAQLRSRLCIFTSHWHERLKTLSTLACALVCLALSVYLGSCAAVYPVAESKATLWKVRGDHNTLYLLGSIHVMSKRAYPLKPVIEHAFDNANAVVFEIDLDRVTKRNFKEEFGRTALYPSGQSLSKHLSPETIDVLNTILPVYGLSLRKVERFKPWFLAEVLSTRTLEMAGFSNDLGVDLHFYRKARVVGKPVLGLETVRDQAQIFDRMDDAENEQYLLTTLYGLPEYPALMQDLVNAWTAGDVGTLDRLVNEDKRADRESHDALFSRRNSRWLPEIERFAHGNGNYLIIVGAGHLVGEDGVVAQLKRAGYSVDQL